MKTKKCKGCQHTLPINKFTRSKNVKDGYENKCKDCRRKAREKYVKNCVVCDTEFRTCSKESKTCSPKCRGVLRMNRVDMKCSYCGKDIQVLKNKAGKHSYYYCNQGCRTEHLKVLMSKEGNPNYNRVLHKCDGCGKLIKAIPSDIENKLKFCSNECYKENIGRFFEGENNNFYNADLTEAERLEERTYKEYYEWRENVFSRDLYTCQRCRDSTGGNLNAHHIYNYSSHKDLRTSLSNGITLCVKCHKDFHGKYGYRDNTLQQIESFMKQTLIL